MLGPRIAALRRQAGMSQAELARILQISPSTVGMYEQGRREPGAELLVAMADAFSVSTDFLLTGRAGTPPERESLEQMMQESLSLAEAHCARRTTRPFSRQELAVILAAMLAEP